MPNWCSNNLVISGEAAEIQRFLDKLGLEDGEYYLSFDKLLPTPTDLSVSTPGVDKEYTDSWEKLMLSLYGYKDWYDWCVFKWGTKWDLDENAIIEIRENELLVSFESAWSPPIAFFDNLIDDWELEIRLEFFETGMWYGGVAYWDKDKERYDKEYVLEIDREGNLIDSGSGYVIFEEFMCGEELEDYFSTEKNNEN